MFDKKTEVSFLVENFDIPAAKAAELVATNEAEASQLTAQQLAKERNQSSFPPGAKVPMSPEDHRIKDDGGLQKTVLDNGNRSERAGP